MRRATLIAASVLLAACGPPAAVATPTPTHSATARIPASPRPTAATATTTPSSTPAPTPRPGVRASAVGALPESFRFVAIDHEIAGGFATTLWLVDLNARQAPKPVADWEGPAAPVGGYSATPDGRSVLVSAAGTRSRVALYLLRPETGAVALAYEEPGVVAVSARISPDGSRFAFTKYPADGGSDLGVWVAPTSAGGATRIGDPSATSVPAMTLAWSTDSSRLALARETDAGSEVHVIAASGGAETVVGPGEDASWRASAPELLVAATTSSPSRAYTYDLATGKTVDVVTSGGTLTRIWWVRWQPALDRFLYVESQADRANSGGIWVRNADGTGPSRVDLGAGSVYAPEWSRDGTKLTAIGGGDDSIMPVVDLSSGKPIAILCRRGGRPPADCT